MIGGIAAVSAAAAALELDSVQAGQFLFSRPSVAGAIFGIMGGDFLSGVQLGLCMELLTIDQVPVGGYVPPSGVVGAACAFALHRWAGFDSGYSFLLGFILAKLYPFVEIKMRQERSSWNARLESATETDASAAGGWVAKALAQQAALVFVFVFSGICLAVCAGGAAWLAMPAKIKPAFMTAYRVAPWLGLAALTAALLPRRGN
ncbi:MAG: PTS sugar transporter subunit IIC [Elusimicrobiales bacterium]